MLFWTLWGVDAVVAAIFTYFFVVGLADGSVSAFNMALWAIILVTLAGLLWGGYTLHSYGRESLAAILLGILAVPSILFGLFFLAVLILNPKWN